MKERPILMTPENAQKCHVGTKTQTRRIVKLQPKDVVWLNNPGPDWYASSDGSNYTSIACPYGVPGDRLWVREAWCVGRPATPSGIGIIPFYGPLKDYPEDAPKIMRYKGAWGDIYPPKWRPAMHMFRWACRTVLEITEIRVQRVQDCSTEDAIAEGVESWEGECVLREKRLTKAQLQYAVLWDFINGPGSWDANPWVWAISFKRVME